MIQIPPPPAEPPAVVEPAPEAPGPVVVTRAPTVSAALTDSEIEVDAGYAGASLVLYGAVFNPGDDPVDVVVVVRGPTRPVRLVRKVRVAGLWLNSRPVVFEGAPAFYVMASTRPLSDIAGFGVLRRMGVGLDHIRIDAPEEQRTVNLYGVRDVVISRLGEDYLDWRRAVIRLKENQGLYSADPGGVRYVDPGLFRAEITLPAEAPTGEYQTEVWLFQNGEAISVRRNTIRVRRVGVERWLHDFAFLQPWLYGLMSVLLAGFTGWAASRWFRRT